MNFTDLTHEQLIRISKLKIDLATNFDVPADVLIQDAANDLKVTYQQVKQMIQVTQ